jgi:hypothetical protein
MFKSGANIIKKLTGVSADIENGESEGVAWRRGFVRPSQSFIDLGNRSF